MKKYISFICVVLAGIFWGCMPLFANALSTLGFLPVQKTAIRMTVAAVTFLFFLAIKSPRSLRVRWRDLPLLFAMGAISTFAMSALYFLSIELTTSAVAAVLLYTSPIFILLASVLLFHEKLNARKIVSLILVVLGCVLVSGIIGSKSGSVNLWGVLAGIVSGICYASYSILGTFALRRYSSATVTAYAFVFAALAAWLFADMPSFVGTVSALPNLGTALLLMLGLGVVTATLPFSLYTYGLSHMEAGRAGILACIEPMTATLISVLVLQEPCTSLQWVGIVLILGAVILLQLSADHSKEKE
ncbi:MAG: EamA family transporter [Clostridia bacterium]|nr:EamA family transporter [Clostridia bacterium]